ncbi:MAG: hypothetical protein AB7D92_10335 [Sphaerochaeta sp.]
MSEERMRILRLLSEGKLSPDEADKLLAAMEKQVVQTETKPSDGKGKYLYVQVEPKEGKSSERVSVKVPFALIKAGLNISKLIPMEAQDKIQESMHGNGFTFDFSSLDTQNMGEILEALELMSVDVDSDESTVKVYCR